MKKETVLKESFIGFSEELNAEIWNVTEESIFRWIVVI